jgi:hypothetical protein
MKIKYCKDCGRVIKRRTAIRCRSCSSKGKLNSNYGKKWTEDVLEKMRGPRPNILGKNNPNWRGGKRKSQGYIYIYCPDHPNAKKKYVKRANLVMEKQLGRYLKKGEVVHHKDENKENDNIKNLILCKNESEHQHKFHQRKIFNPSMIK